MSLTISTINVNGIRAAMKQRSEANRGLSAWLDDVRPDVVLLQEIRAGREQAQEALAPVLDDGWHLVMSESVIKGHAGVGVLSRVEPSAVRVGFGSDEFDATGRYLEADFDTPLGALTAASLYLPKGAAQTDDPKDIAKHDEKIRFMTAFAEHLRGLVRRRRHVVVGGDWNIATVRVRVSFRTNGIGWVSSSRAVGVTWSANSIPTTTVRTRGGHGEARPSTTTPDGASTIS